ncbi:MAG: hypothetical protein Q9201_001878 [Fulgogasparrea decipioides]
MVPSMASAEEIGARGDRIITTAQYRGRRKERDGKLVAGIPRFEYVEPDLDFFGPGDIVYDRRFPVEPIRQAIYRRQDGVGIDASSTGGGGAKTTAQRHLRFSSTSTASPAATTSAAAAFTSAILPNSKSSSSTPSTAPSSIVTAPGVSSNLPRPFDTGLGNNYTNPKCPAFINDFLRNETFTACHPFSFLLQNSMSFFSATKSESAITKTLNASCNMINANCNTLMSSLATQLRRGDNCADDYRRQQPLVISAYNALIAYEPLFKAGCERDEQGKYCFANAITNRSSPTDSYPYYLPLGIALPGGSRPTCSQCLKNTMATFNQAANSNSQPPLATTYSEAAQMINVGCGPLFTNKTITASKSAGQDSFGVRGFGPPSTMKILAGVTAVLGALF